MGPHGPVVSIHCTASIHRTFDTMWLTYVLRHYKVPSLAEHGKHVQFLHRARARLLGSIILFYCSSFHSSTILDSDSDFYPLCRFIYHKNLMCTKFSVVEPTPPSHQLSWSRSFVQSAPVVAVSISPPVFKLSHTPLTRAPHYTFRTLSSRS